jgi:D-glycero-D-manno-heptose 1,7-bisphosphate phosphatase
MDRDGVINRKAPEGEYVTRWEDFHFLPGVAEGIALLNRAGFSVIVVTNQRCIAKGLMTVAALEEMHKRMTNYFARAGAAIDGIYHCPHELDQSCGCRKPAPGMLLDAARSRGIELPASWMIGDSDIDIEAGKSAGCKTAQLVAMNGTTGKPGSRDVRQDQADIVAPSLLDAVHQILHLQGVEVGSVKIEPAAT